MVTLYGIKNCTTMKKASAWLDARGIDYAFTDYKSEAVLSKRLPVWVKTVGVEVLLNRRGLTWRKLPESVRAVSTESDIVALLRAHPTLIKRPVLETDKYLLVGFEPEQYAALFEERT